MKTLTKKNFIEFLVKNEACKPGLDWAKKQRRARDIVKKCTNASYLYWLIGAIGGSMWAEYKEKEAPFRVEYKEKRDIFWVEYKEKRILLRAEYLEKCNILAKELCTFERVQEELGE